MKKIVVPTDLSELSLNALKLAILLAKSLESKIDLVYVINKTNHMDKSEIREKLVEIENEYKKDYPNIQHHIKEGKIYEEIVYHTERFKDSILATSTHGVSGLEELFIGSNAYKIISFTIQPVFTIRGNEIPDKIKKIVLPIDVTPETREKVPFTALLAKKLDAEILVITISETHLRGIEKKITNYGTQVCKYLDKYEIKNSMTHIEGNNLADVTVNYAIEEKAQLISAMSQQEKNVSNYILGNYTHQMINKSTIPVLIFPTRHIGRINDSFHAAGIS